MPEPIQIVPTVGEIARRIGCPVHRVEYVIRTRDIQPSGRAGNVRVFTDADVERIACELRRIDAEIEHQREGGGTSWTLTRRDWNCVSRDAARTAAGH